VPDGTSVIVGDPSEVTRHLRELRARIGKFGTLVLVAHDWDDRSRWLRSLETKVRPALTPGIMRTSPWLIHGQRRSHQTSRLTPAARQTDSARPAGCGGHSQPYFAAS